MATNESSTSDNVAIITTTEAAESVSRHDSGLQTTVHETTASAARLRLKSTTSCSGCGRPIADRFLLYAMDRHWHVGCLRCSVCQVPLDDAVATCYTRAGLILCRSDYVRMFGISGTCAACRQAIPASQLVMRARQLAYHVDCFTCAICGVRLVPGDRYAVVNESLVCETDYRKVCGLHFDRASHSQPAPDFRCITNSSSLSS